MDDRPEPGWAVFFALATAGLVASCAAPSASNATSDAAAGVVPAYDAAPAYDAGSPGFGGVAGAPAAPKLAVTFIDDGGRALLPDGAIIYVLFSARPCPSDNTLSYENFGAAFFASYCQRCHSAKKQGSDRSDAPSDLNYDDLPSIRALSQRIWGQAGDSNITMPAGAPKPTPDERVKLGAWLACGAPGGSAGADAASKPSP